MQTQPQFMNFLSQNYPVLSCSKEANKDRTERRYQYLINLPGAGIFSQLLYKRQRDNY